MPVEANWAIDLCRERDTREPFLKGENKRKANPSSWMKEEHFVELLVIAVEFVGDSAGKLEYAFIPANGMHV